jgi:hypothetical protein
VRSSWRFGFHGGVIVLGWRQSWVSAGFLLASLAVPLDASPALAQGITSDSFITRVVPTRPARARPSPSGPDDLDPAASLRGSILPADSVGPPAAGPSSEEPTPTGPRPPVVDGDLGDTAALEPPRDGVVDGREPPSPDAGDADAALGDTRSAEDHAAFASPPVGYDPDAFAIEVEPILDRRPERLARFEPYQQVGIRIGSFTALPEAEFEFGSFSNVFSSAVQPRRDVAYEVRPSLRMISNWRVHALEFYAKGRASFHEEFSSEDDRAYIIETRGRLDISRRTTIEALIGQDLTQDSRSDISAPTSAREPGDITTRRAALTLNHRLNRLSLQLRGTITDTDYGPVETLSGERISNDDRDVTIYEMAVRAQWEFRPSLFAFAEVAHNIREHVAATSDGILRDSRGERMRVGLSFGNTSRILRGEASIGYGIQRPDDSRLADIDGLIVDANVAYRWSPLTSVLFIARSEIGETTLPDVSGALSRQAGIEVRHALRRNLFAIAGLSSTWQDYDGTDLRERELIASLATEFFVSRELALYARYRHTDFSSTEPGRSFDADEFRVGMRIRR